MSYWLASPQKIFKQNFVKYQQDWLQDKSKYKLGEKSRRCGLTWTEAFDDVTLAAKDAVSGGMDVFYLSTREELAKEFIDTCKDWVIALQSGGIKLVGDFKKDIQTTKIKFLSGFKITALTSNSTNMRGLGGRIVIDEAAFQTDLREVLKAAIACTMWKGDIRLISTLNGMEVFLEEVEAVKNKSKPGSVHTIPIDRALHEGLYLKIHQKRGLPLDMPDSELYSLQKEWLSELVSIYGEASAEELYCIPSTGSSSYFPVALIKNSFQDSDTKILTYFKQESFQELTKADQLADVDEWINNLLLPEIDKHLQLNYVSFLGMDFARIRHLSVISILFNPYSGQCFSPLHIELRKVPYPCQARILEALLIHLKDCLGLAMDASGNALSLAEDIEYFRKSSGRNFKVFPIKFTQPALRDIFNHYQNGLEAGKLVLPADVDIVQDHLRLIEKNGLPSAVEYKSIREKSQGSIIRHCDSAYSYALAYHCYSQFDPHYELPIKESPKKHYSKYSIGALRR